MKKRPTRSKRLFIRIVQVALLLAGVWFLVAWLAAEALMTHAELARADVIMVLSNASTFKERTRHAAGLWKQQRAPIVIVTNDSTLSSWSAYQKRNPFFYELAISELEQA